MSDVDWVPQFAQDHDAWVRLLFQTPDPADRIVGYSSAPDLLLGEILRYGAYNDSGMVGDLFELYRGMATEGGMPLPLRRAVYQHVKGHQQEASVFSANVYLPFVACEADRGITSTAVIDFVSLAPITNGDPMSRVREVIAWIEHGSPLNVGATFGALLHLGDPRVCRLLWPLKDMLEEDAVREAMLCRAGILGAATTEFLVHWLLGMDGDARDALFGHVASGLFLQRRDMRLPVVSTGERPFPVTSVTPEEQNRMQRFISIEDFTKQIAPALLELERTEPEPKVMPEVLAIWGLGPQPRRRVGT
ncbi:hypothetical protein E0493_22560 [Roseomonas sp. M0104]|uniref:Uncharacterized protein n=1 Tax=Teichococcus coralli TaxID=2545983 RepID=A0A845BJ87_9PROT|nr:hypothetical protein [Pseudoroseomonas coralli]MXP66124.1 hypothetical protein [Pseudoroseomonas coralli]